MNELDDPEPLQPGWQVAINEEAFERIAAALERIATRLEGGVISVSDFSPRQVKKPSSASWPPPDANRQDAIRAQMDRGLGMPRYPDIYIETYGVLVNGAMVSSRRISAEELIQQVTRALERYAHASKDEITEFQQRAFMARDNARPPLKALEDVIDVARDWVLVW